MRKKHRLTSRAQSIVGVRQTNLHAEYLPDPICLLFCTLRGVNSAWRLICSTVPEILPGKDQPVPPHRSPTFINPTTAPAHRLAPQMICESNVATFAIGWQHIAHLHAEPSRTNRPAQSPASASAHRMSASCARAWVTRIRTASTFFSCDLARCPALERR